MNQYFAKKSRRVMLWVVFLSIIGLMLIQLLPWVSVTDSSSTEENAITYNFASMEKSGMGPAKGIQIINVLFWLVLVFGLLSLIGAVLYLSNTYSSLGVKLLLSGCATLILGILIVILLSKWLVDVEGTINLSATSIGPLPIKYAYFPMMMGIGIFIYSVPYVWSVVSFAIECKKTLEKQKKLVKKQIPKKVKKKKNVKKPIVQSENKVVKSPSTLTQEIEEWLEGEVQHVEEPVEENVPIQQKEEQIEIPKEEIPEPEKVEEKQPQPNIFPDEQKAVTPQNIPAEQKEEQIKPPEEEVDEKIVAAQEFEKALSSAIEKKRQTGNYNHNSIETEEKIQDKAEEAVEEETKEESKTRQEYQPPEENKQEIHREGMQIEEKLAPEQIIQPQEQVKPTQETIPEPEKVEEKQPQPNIVPDKQEAVTPQNIPAEQKEEQTKHPFPSPFRKEEKIEVINLRCPACKHIFSFEKGEGEVKIKCPNCNAEGVVK